MPFPENRPDDYKPNNDFDESVNDWADYASDLTTHGGSRYNPQLVVVSEKGRIYFSEIADYELSSTGPYEIEGMLFDDATVVLEESEGDKTAIFTQGTTFDIENSVSNNGSYVSEGALYLDMGSEYDVTAIVVNTTLSDEYPPTAAQVTTVITAAGPGGIFEVGRFSYDNPYSEIFLESSHGDVMLLFTAGTTFDVTGSTSNDGSYTILDGGFEGGESILLVGNGAAVLTNENPTDGQISNVVTA